MRKLEEIYSNWSYSFGYGDKGTAHSYIPEYSRLLEPYREGGSILEIGLAYGHSLELWDEYFNNGVIYGIERRTDQIYPYLSDPRFNIIISGATKESTVELLNDATFDVIIDDASHMIDHQLTSFKLFKSKVNPGGIYIIEDVADLDADKHKFEKLHDNIEIIDNRSIKNRYDDVLIVYRF